MNVEQLATLEETWLKKQRQLVGDRKVLYEQAGVYAAWREILGHYVAVARAGDLEALKRALYLIWAERSIGPVLTGLKDLDKATVRETLELADRLARDGRLDAELEWMLPYYYLVDPSYLDRFENLDALKHASRQRPFAYRGHCLETSFEHRGQMGEYWRIEQAHQRRWT
jgi:hypothetical protein